MKVCRVGLLLAAALSLPSGRVRLLATSAGVRAKSCASSWGAKQLDVSVPVPDWLSFHGGCRRCWWIRLFVLWWTQNCKKKAVPWVTPHMGAFHFGRPGVTTPEGVRVAAGSLGRPTVGYVLSGEYRSWYLLTSINFAVVWLRCRCLSV